MNYRKFAFRIQRKESGGGTPNIPIDTINPKLSQMKTKINKMAKTNVLFSNSLVLGSFHVDAALKALQSKQIDRKDYDHLQSGIIRSP